MAVVPSILMFSFFTSYFITDRTQDVLRNLERQGELLANYLASVSGYGLTSGNVDNLKEIVEGLLRDNQVYAVPGECRGCKWTPRYSSATSK